MSRTSVGDDLVAISRSLARAADKLTFGPPVTHVYNPLIYAAKAHEAYLRQWGHNGIEILFLGMNPGPFGMAQTGVPFGEVSIVRDWLGIEETIGHPSSEHPKRPIEGFHCLRSEVSGQRYWDWAKQNFGTPKAFFARHFVTNYCPLIFLEESGRNRTPNKLTSSEQKPLFLACDQALRAVVDLLKPKIVVGIGRFAEAQALKALDGKDVTVGTILHPSPASPAANRGWAKMADAQLGELRESTGL